MATTDPLNICLATAELTPLAKTGGLADVSAALSAQLGRNGHAVLTLMPLHDAILKNDRYRKAIRPVVELQGLSVDVGSQRIEYSIDSIQLDDNPREIHLIRCPALFDRDALYTADPDEHLRYAMLSLTALDVCNHLKFAVDVFHCNDWHTGLLPLFLKTQYADIPLFSRARSVMTIHNIGYQGVFSSTAIGDLGMDDHHDLLDADDLSVGQLNYLKTGVRLSDAVTTVSPTYAREIQTPEFGHGLDGILRNRQDSVTGILNGVDYEEWNPATDTRISSNYTATDLSGKVQCKDALIEHFGLDEGRNRPIIGIVSRLAVQKGIDLMERVLPVILVQRDFSLVVLGSGEPHYEEFFAALSDRMPRRVGFHRGYSEDLAHQIEAGSDMFLMPSAYEPCGLNQMYSLKYGTIPIVRKTGGLADSVSPIDPASGRGTGVVFEHYDDNGLAWAIGTALDHYADPALWHKVMQNCMAMDFSWAQQTAEYERLFRQVIAR